MRRPFLVAVALAPLFATAAVAAKSGSGLAQLPRPKVEILPGLGRVTFPPAGASGYVVGQDGDQLVITHAQGGRIKDPLRLPRNVIAMASDATTTSLRLVPGARVGTRRVGAGLIVELLDPPPLVRVGSLTLPAGPDLLSDWDAAPPTPATTPMPAAIAEPSSDTGIAGSPGQAADVRVASIATSPSAAPVPVIIESVPGTATPTILLRAARDVGAAAFRAGPDILVVLDAPIEYRLPAAEMEPMFRQITIRRTQDATVLRFPMTSDLLRIAHSPRGWLVTTAAVQDAVASIVPQLVEDGSDRVSLRLPTTAPSRVVSLTDPELGGHLLVGTQNVSGQAITTKRTQVQFTLRNTLQGVVVATRSDDIRLRRDMEGFTLTAGPHAGNTILSSDERRTADAQLAMPMSRLFSIPNDTASNLLQRLERQTRDAADAPALARSRPRIALAETLLGLGMGVEAQAVLEIAMSEDPTLRDEPHVVGLHAVGALLAHRDPDGAALIDPRLNGTAEIELWRALLKVARRQAGVQDAHQLVAGLPLLMSYPPGLRNRLLPQALETMALNGEAAAAQAALRPLDGERTLDLTRAMVLEAAGQTDEALHVYDRVTSQADRLQRYQAMVRAVELRLRSGKIGAGEAVGALDHALFGWRGAQQELALRIRIAGLRRQLGQWREALTVLREGLAALPDDREALDHEMAAVVEALFTGEAASRLAPADFVALYDGNADAIRSISWTEKNGMPLVDRLIGLGLLGRAEPMLAQVLAQTGDPGRRAVLGARLAMLRLSTSDPSGAIRALSDTAPGADATADPAVMTARQMLYARAENARGKSEAALRMLEMIGTVEADEARADIQGNLGNWPGAVAALADLEHRQIGSGDEPVALLTPDQQALVMRLTVAATLAADNAMVVRMRTSYGPAMEKGSSAPTFRLMTSAPVRDMTDLPRAYQEIKMAQQIKAQISAEVRP